MSVGVCSLMSQCASSGRHLSTRPLQEEEKYGRPTVHDWSQYQSNGMLYI